MKLDSKLDRVSAIRAMFAVVFVSLTFWFTGGMLGKDMGSFIEALLPPDNYKELMGGAPTAVASTSGNTSVTDSHALWVKDLAEAKKKGKGRK